MQGPDVDVRVVGTDGNGQEAKWNVGTRQSGGRKKALGAWFQRCRVEVGDVGIRTFKKLMSSLVESSMLYGAEIWGCSQNLEALEQIQLRAFRMFFGVGTIYPRVSLLLEVRDLPVVWLARLHCTLFWLKVLSSKVYERLLRRVAVEAVKYGKGS